MLVLLFCFFLQCSYDTINLKIFINGAPKPQKNNYFIKTSDTILIQSKQAVYWYNVQPKLKEYFNEKRYNLDPVPVIYKLWEINKEKRYNQKFTFSDAGTYYIAVSNSNNQHNFKSKIPIQYYSNRIIKIVVRKDDTYIGLISELLGLPFILPPIHIRSLGHQTDLHMGTDCAELAIYGMRRLGYNIPYVGPKKLWPYLLKETQLQVGTLIHFGFQVSILYKDLGKIGKLDDDDLLIHAYQDAVKIQRFGDTELIHKKYILASWNIKKLERNKYRL